MSTIYNRDYFIAKFEAIPEDQWCRGMMTAPGDKSHCALGHCGALSMDRDSEESKALRGLFYANGRLSVINVNDVRRPTVANPSALDRILCRPTPKQRILAALRSFPQ